MDILQALLIFHLPVPHTLLPKHHAHPHGVCLQQETRMIMLSISVIRRHQQYAIHNFMFCGPSSGTFMASPDSYSRRSDLESGPQAPPSPYMVLRGRAHTGAIKRWKGHYYISTHSPVLAPCSSLGQIIRTDHDACPQE